MYVYIPIGVIYNILLLSEIVGWVDTHPRYFPVQKNIYISHHV